MFRYATRLAGYALAAGIAFSSSIASAPTFVKTPDDIRRDAIITHARANHAQFRAIGLASILENIEHGGLATWKGDTIAFREIPNRVRHCKDRYERYMHGNFEDQEFLSTMLFTAAAVQGVCNPDSKEGYYCRAANLNSQLLQLASYPPEFRELPAKNIWIEYASFVLPNMYCMDDEAAPTLPAAYHFHVHQNHTPPSLQDCKLSNERIEIVESIGSDGSDDLYYVENGNVRIIASAPAAETVAKLYK